MKRGNVDVATRALTLRVLFEGKKAVGVEYSQGGEVKQARAGKEVIAGICKSLLNLVAGFKRLRPGEAYNIGNTNNEISMYDLGKMYASLIPGSTVNRIPYPSTYPAGEPQRRCPDLTKAKKHLGYASKVDLQAGLATFVDWARQQAGYRD